MKTAAQLFPLSLLLSILFLLIYNPKQYRHSTEHFFSESRVARDDDYDDDERERKRRIRKERKIRKNLRFSVCSCSYYFPTEQHSHARKILLRLSLSHTIFSVCCAVYGVSVLGGVRLQWEFSFFSKKNLFKVCSSSSSHT